MENAIINLNYRIESGLELPAITTAEEAISTGDRFIRKYYPYLRPLSAKQEERAWHVVFDVSVFIPKRVEVRIAPETGSIIELNDLSQSQ